jgi:hypothetical protein
MEEKAMSDLIKKFYIGKECAYIHYDEICGEQVKNQTRKFPNPDKAREWVRTELIKRKVCNVRFVVAQKLDVKLINTDTGETF